MERKIIVSITLICFVICMQGCTSKYTVLPEHLEEKPVYSKVTVETLDGEAYYFDNIFVRDGCIEGYVEDTVLVSIPLEDVESVRVSAPNALKTIGLTLWILSGLFFLALILIARSIPDLP